MSHHHLQGEQLAAFIRVQIDILNACSQILLAKVAAAAW